MTQLSFDDLIPQGGAQASAPGLSFDDLVPHRAEMRAAPAPSLRERITNAIIGDERPSPEWRRLAEGVPNALSLIPPVGVALSGDQSAHEAARGDLGKAATYALGVIPAPGVSAPARAISTAAQPRPAPSQAVAFDDLVPAAPQAKGVPFKHSSTTQGRFEVVTPDQSMRVQGTPEIVELADLKMASGQFQPRDRSRAEYVTEAIERARKLDPQQLMPGRVSDSGAPIILPDGTIISGNGRALSIKEVYSNPQLAEQAKAYRASLGPDAANMKQPVLVVRADDMGADDAVRFADLSNRGRIAQMSATERAARDAQAIGQEGIALYQGGEFTAPQNREFFRLFSDKAVLPAERAAFSKEGQLTQEGVARMRSSILHGAYGDSAMISRMLESTDDNIRNLTGALTDAAPGFAGLRADVKAGQVIPDLDITDKVVSAVKMIADLRSRGISPAVHLSQRDAFAKADPVAEAWVRAFYNDDLTRPVSRQKMTEVLNAYTTEARKHAPGGLFGDETTAKDVLDAAKRVTARQAEQPSPAAAGASLF